MRRSALVGLASCLAAAAVIAAPKAARAGTYVGAQIDLGTPIGSTPGQTPTFGAGGNIGYRFGLGPVFLQPEAMGHYTLLTGDGDGARATRILGGLRFGLGGLLQPAIFAHAGGGFLRSDAIGPAFDLGLQLTFKLVPFLRFGAQVAYNVVSTKSPDLAYRWVSYGLQAGIEF